MTASTTERSPPPRRPAGAEHNGEPASGPGITRPAAVTMALALDDRPASPSMPPAPVEAPGLPGPPAPAAPPPPADDGDETARPRRPVPRPVPPPRPLAGAAR